MGVSSHCNLPILSLWDESKAAGPLIYYKDRCWREAGKKKVRSKERKIERERVEERERERKQARRRD